MSLAEQTLISYLTDAEACGHLARHGVPEEVIPTPSMRRVVTFALAYYSQSGKAPTKQVLLDGYADDFEVAEIELEEFEPDESVEWALETLFSNYARKEAQAFSTRFTEAVTNAEPTDRIEAISEQSASLSALAMQLQPRTSQVDMRTAGSSMLAEYDYRKEHRGTIIGARFGLPAVDEHIGGIWPGELAIVAAGTKVGKSWVLDYSAYNEWLAERVAALFTLENSISMTQGRIACLALQLDPGEWMRGRLDDADEKNVREWVEDVLKVSDTPLLIFNPSRKMRTPQSMAQVARAHDAETLIIDQLTFMRNAETKKGQAKAYDTGEILHDTKELISTGSHMLSCIMAHQVNREGMKAAAKTGYLEPHHMADTSEVERTVDHLAALYQSDDDKKARRAKWQYMLSRRAVPMTWNMTLNLSASTIAILGEIDLSAFVTTGGDE